MILISENKIAHDSYIRIVGLFLATNGISIFQTDADRQGEVKRMLSAVALNVTAVVEEILKTRLYVEAYVRREVVLEAKSHGCGPLERYAELVLHIICTHTIVNMIHAESTVYWHFHHNACRGV
jgi:Na+/serine symporter